MVAAAARRVLAGADFLPGDVVDLINGHEFVDLMVMHGVWVKRNEYNMLSIT